MLSGYLTISLPAEQEHSRFTTFRMCTMHGLGSASSPVVLSSASGELGTPEPTTYLLVQLVSTFSLFWMTTFISDLLSLAIPCFTLAPNCSMLAAITSPHGSVTVLADAATLSQAHFIQPGRVLGAEPQVKSSLREFLRLHMRLSCRTPVVQANDARL